MGCCRALKRSGLQQPPGPGRRGGPGWGGEDIGEQPSATGVSREAQTGLGVCARFSKHFPLKVEQFERN